MDEEVLLELLAEYSGNWKERQYYEHVIREIQKKQHLIQLISDHKHDPRDQLMLEASKRKTVVEIEKKFQVSTINSQYIFPRNNMNHLNVRQQEKGQLKQLANDPNTDDDSYNNSLDVDFYNLKAQNVSKKKNIKVIQSNDSNKAQQISSQHEKAHTNQSKQSNDSNCQSPISRPLQQQQSNGGFQDNHKVKGTTSSVMKVDGGNKQNNNENYIINNVQYQDEINDNKNSKTIKNILNPSQGKNLSANKNDNINTQIINHNNNQSTQANGSIISPIKQSQKSGNNDEVYSPNQVFKQIQNGSNNQTKSTAHGYLQQQYQKTFLQNQIKQQQQTMLRTSQEDHLQVQKIKAIQQQFQNDSTNGTGNRLNTCTNEVDKDPDIIKAKKQTKSSSNSPISKANGQAPNINNYYYLSPQQQQTQYQQIISSAPNTQQQLQKKNNNYLNQPQQLKENSSQNFKGDKQDFQYELKTKIKQQLTATSTNSTSNYTPSQAINKNQNISSGSGKDAFNIQKQILIGNNQKEINKHSKAIEQILYRQQQQNSQEFNQPHQILNTLESANGNDDSSLSMNQITSQSSKQQEHDSEQIQILKQIHSQQQNQNNIYNSKKLYQLNSNNSNNQQINKQQDQKYVQQSIQNYTANNKNKQRNQVQQNGTQSQNNVSNNQQSYSPFVSSSQQNIIVNNSQLQHENILSNHNLEQNSSNLFNINGQNFSNLQFLSNNANTQMQAHQIIANLNTQGSYLNDNILQHQPYIEHQTNINHPLLSNEDIISQNSNGVDSQRKSSIKNKKIGMNNNGYHVLDQQDHKLNTGNSVKTSHQKVIGDNIQQSETQSSQYKNKWIDFKKNNQQNKGSDRINNGVINQTQYEDHGKTSGANARNTFNSVSPNGNQNYNNNNNKKCTTNINNYLSLSSTINNLGNQSSIQGNSTSTNKQGLTNSMSSSNHYQNNSQLLQQSSFLKQQSQNQGSHTTNNQNIQQQLLQSQELAAYQIKNGKIGIEESQSMDKNYHTQFINNTKQQYEQQQQFLLKQCKTLEDHSNQNSIMSQKNQQRKQMSKVNSCKNFEVRDKFSKTTSKNNANNVVINLSNANNCINSCHPQMNAQNLNHTTGNHNMSGLNYNNNSSNINNSALTQNQNLCQSLNNQNSQSKQNLLGSSNIIKYLPSSQIKNTYSAALYQKSQNNILSKQAKNPTESSVSNLFNAMRGGSSNGLASNSALCNSNIHSSNNVLSTSNLCGTSGMNSSMNQIRNNSQNATSSVTQSMNNVNLNSYLTTHNQNSNAKNSKKIDICKVFSSTNSNSFTNQKDNQQPKFNQAKNLGLVLQKMIKNKSVKTDEKNSQINNQIQITSNHIQNNLIPNNISQNNNNIHNSNGNHQPLVKQQTPGKKKMSTSGNTQQQNNANNNSTYKSPQISSQLKKNNI